jgi:hypothetical protein
MTASGRGGLVLVLLKRRIQNLALTLIFIIMLFFSYHRIQVSYCCTFLMIRDVPSTAFFVQNLLNVVLVLFPDIFKLLLTILVTTIIIIIIAVLLLIVLSHT